MSNQPYYKTVLFDLDGTLLDTLQDLGDSVNHALGELGYPPLPYSHYKIMVGYGTRHLCTESLRTAMAARDPKTVPPPDDPGFRKDAERAFDSFRSYYAEHINVKTKPYPGIADALRQAYETGASLGVISNKLQSYSERLLRSHFPEIGFRYIIGDGGGFPRKPDPASIRHILADSGYPASEAVMFGDGETDMEVCRAAGIDSAAVLWGFRDRETLAGAGAGCLVRTPEEIIRIVCGGICHD